MSAPYAAMTGNAPGARIFENREELADFAVVMANRLADLLVVITHSDADEGFLKSAMEMACDYGFQLQQANEMLRDGPDCLFNDSEWYSPAKLGAPLLAPEAEPVTRKFRATASDDASAIKRTGKAVPA
jgi:hypothetical protein